MSTDTLLSAPVRIQRRRTAGWTMPPGAVYVGRHVNRAGRPTLYGRWGNPFRPLPGGHWKTCIREVDHTEDRHVWVESYAKADGRPIIATWMGPRCATPLIAEIHVPDGGRQ